LVVVACSSTRGSEGPQADIVRLIEAIPTNESTIFKFIPSLWLKSTFIRAKGTLGQGLKRSATEF
jgi:hypothetical protein